MHLTLGFYSIEFALFIVSINFTYRSIKRYSSIVFIFSSQLLSFYIYIRHVFTLSTIPFSVFFYSWVWLFTWRAGERASTKKESWLLSAWQCSLKIFCCSSYNCRPNKKREKESIYLYFMIFPNRLCTPASHSDVASAFDGHWYWYKNWQ